MKLLRSANATRSGLVLVGGIAVVAALLAGLSNLVAQDAAKAAPKYARKIPAEAYKPGLPDDFKPYVATIPETNLQYVMTPIPGGEFIMGSPSGEAGREENEGPQLKVKVAPFWMGVYEVTWDEFDVFSFAYDKKAAKEAKEKNKPLERSNNDLSADNVSRPTPPYVDMTFGRGHDEIPASCMTVEAAIHFCEWLSAKTGHEYRLPTEAEWEYAARHGKSTPYFFGSDVKQLDDYAWHAGNSDEKPRAVGAKKVSPWGLYDIYGNVREWTSDKYDAEWYKSLAADKVNVDPKNKPGILQKARRKDYPARQEWHSVRGGSYQDDATWCRSAWRLGAEEDWSVQDPQLPKSVWWHTDASFVGFRIVRSYKPAGK